MAKSIQLEASKSQYLSITKANQTGIIPTSNNGLTIETCYKLTSGENFNICDVDGVFGYVLRSYHQSLYFHYWFSGFSQAAFQWIGYPTGVWVRISLAIDKPNGLLKGYVNGNSVGSLGIDASNWVINSNPFRIGLTGGNWSGYANGKFFDFRVFNTVRTPTEISDNHNKFIDPATSGLVANWFKGDESLQDATSNNNDLTNNNSATFSTDIPDWAVVPASGFRPQIFIY